MREKQGRDGEPEWLSPLQMAALLAIGRTTSYKLLRDGAIPSSRVGKLRRVHVNDVRRFMEKNRDGRGDD